MTATDYQSLIDASTWAFIARTQACYPADTAQRSITEQRAVYDAMCRVFHAGYPPGVKAHDQPIAGVPCRNYAGAQPTLIYFHGGSWVVGGLHSHDDVCADICHRTGLRVISVDYRLSPEHIHPAALEDALAVTRAVAATGPYLLAGDSAGANTASAVAHALRHSDAPPRGLVQIYPSLSGDFSSGSYITHAHAPMLTTDDLRYYAELRQDRIHRPKTDPTAYPLQDSDFTGLPPTVSFSAECDPHADDGRDYCDRIIAAGGTATWHLEAGLVHGYLRARHMVPRAAASFDRIICAISSMGATP